MMNDAFRYAHLEVVGSQGDGPPLCALVGSGGRDEVRLLDMRGAHERFRHSHPPQGGGGADWKGVVGGGCSVVCGGRLRGLLTGGGGTGEAKFERYKCKQMFEHLDKYLHYQLLQ